MSYFGCDLCFAESVRYNERVESDDGQRDKRKKKKGATHVYPAGSRSGAILRTHARHMELARREGPASDEDNDFYGVKEGIPFLSEILPDFDLVRDICIDWMHLVCEGSSLFSLIFLG